MVATPGLLELPLIRLKFCRRLEESAIDALQHRVLLTAPPVGASNAHELEDRDLARMIHMPTAAQVREGSVRALGDVVVLDVLQQIELEGLVMPALFGFGTRNGRHLKGMVARDGRAHTLLEPGEILLRQRAGQAEVIVEASLD